MANKQQILYPGEHAPWRFRQSNILLTPYLRANTRGYARTMCQGMQQMLKVLETLYEAVQRCLQKSAHHLFSAFFQLGLVRFAAIWCWQAVLLGKTQLFRSCPIDPSMGSILRQLSHATLAKSCIAASCGMANRQMRSKYSHHFNTPEAPKFPAVSPVKDAKIACQPLELTTKVVQSLRKLIWQELNSAYAQDLQAGLQSSQNWRLPNAKGIQNLRVWSNNS